MIASIGHGLPVDLLVATGRYAGPVAANADAPTPFADRWLESKFAPFARAILEDWKEGALDGHEAIVFTRADDSVQRLYYYVCELQRLGELAGPRPLICDIAKVTRPTSAARQVAAVRVLAGELGVADAELEAGIIATNAQRHAARPEGAGAHACFLTGTPPPDHRLHAAISDAGYVAVGPVLAEEWGDPGPEVAEGTGDPVSAIGAQLHGRFDAGRGFGDTGAVLAARARDAGAAAAVQWYIEEDEARVWDAPAVTRALEALGLPVLVLTRRDWAARDGAADEIAAFLRGAGA